MILIGSSAVGNQHDGPLTFDRKFWILNFRQVLIYLLFCKYANNMQNVRLLISVHELASVFMLGISSEVVSLKLLGKYHFICEIIKRID